MSRILIVQPDSSQVSAVRETFPHSVSGYIVVADSLDEALGSIDRCIPDVILLPDLISAVTEDYLVTYLGTIPGAEHVQILGLPRFERLDISEPPPRWPLFRWLRRRAPRLVIPGPDPRVFMENVLAYLAGAEAIKKEIELYGPTVLRGPERRRETRFADYEVPWISVLKLGNEEAALINVSSRGALLQTDTRPPHHLLRRTDPNVPEPPRLILELESEERIHALGRVIRCVPLTIGTQTLYEVAFSFDDTVNIQLPVRTIVTRRHLHPSSPNPWPAYK